MPPEDSGPLWVGDEGSGEDRPRSLLPRGKYFAAGIAAVFLSGVSAAYLAETGFIPYPSTVIMGGTILLATILVCCYGLGIQASLASKMPEYGELETKFEQGMLHYQAKEWNQALDVFRDVMGPNKNHKRALYYSARCHEQLGDWSNVKYYCQLYLQMQPKDREAWELLAAAHKRLFEYEDAEQALAKATRLKKR
jgi:hypothetical protein